MLSASRRDLLIERLRIDGRLIAKELALELDTSEDTIRRDLREMAAAGLCHRVYGGALPASPAVVDYRSRAAIEPDSKSRVAAAAVELVHPGATIFLDGGTSTLAMARTLPLDLKATVITHSPTVAVALGEHPHIELHLIGGRIFRHSMVACGAVAIEALAGVTPDIFFLGVTGVHAETGLTTGDVEEAAMKRAIVNRAVETYVLASAEKIGAASPYTVIPLEAVAGIITDADPSSTPMKDLKAAGVPMIAAAD